MDKFNELTATATLSEWDLFFIQGELKALVTESLRLASQNTPWCLPYMLESPWGKELHTNVVHRTARHIEGYIKKLELIPPSETVDEWDGSIEDLLQLNSVESKSFRIDLTFAQWGVVEHLFDERGKERNMSDICSSTDDWTPPDNFQNGTDDEREIWDNHVASQKARSSLKGQSE